VIEITPVNLTVLDLNVWHGLFARTFWRVELLEGKREREQRISALIEGVRELAPDVVALQECFPQPEFGRAFAAALGYEHVGHVSNAGVRMFGYGFPFGVKTGEGSSILARPGLGLRPLGVRNLSGWGWTHGLLSLQPVPKRCAVAAEVTVEGKRVVVVTAHLRYEFSVEADLDRAWRELAELGHVRGEVPEGVRASVKSGIATRDAELGALRDWCAALDGRGPFVLAADMNLDDDAPALRGFVEKLRLTSALAAVGNQQPTWDPVGNPHVLASAAYAYHDGQEKDVAALLVAQHDRWLQRPDHVFLGPSFARSDLLDARVVLDQPRDGTGPSDHYGILAKIRVG
jgi:endonuclease/exonuclease/phosphatase family metal-dependent hydrolase